FFCQAEVGIRDFHVTGVQTCALPISLRFDLELSGFASLEAQCAAIADDIAYNAHDIDDGLRSGLLTLEQLEEVPLTRDILQEVQIGRASCRATVELAVVAV